MAHQISLRMLGATGTGVPPAGTGIPPGPSMAARAFQSFSPAPFPTPIGESAAPSAMVPHLAMVLESESER